MDHDHDHDHDHEHELVLVAACERLVSACTDFRDLAKRLKHGLEFRGAALVRKNADGHPKLVEAANRYGRMGTGLGQTHPKWLPREAGYHESARCPLGHPSAKVPVAS